MEERMNWNRRKNIPSETGGFKPRVTHAQPSRKKLAKYTIKCGCCDNQIDVHYDDQILEIGGVAASRQEWAAILMPLLR